MEERSLRLLEEPHELAKIWSVQFAAARKSPLHLLRFSPLSGLASLALDGEEVAGQEERPARLEEYVGFENYLLPALYQGIFEKIVWVAREDEKRRQDSSFAVHAKKFEISIREEEKGSRQAEGFLLHERSITDCLHEISPMQVCEIHYAYFSSLSKPQPGNCEIEIARQAAQEYEANPYHALRLFAGAKVEVIHEQERALLRFYSQRVPTLHTRKVSKEVMERRIDAVVQCILAAQVQNVFLCRGVRSGRVCAEQAEFMEKTLLEKLKTHFPSLQNQEGALL